MQQMIANGNPLFFSAFLFRYVHIRRHIETSEKVMLEVSCERHTLLFCEQGEGRIYIGSELHPFISGKIYPMAPGENYQLEHNRSGELRYTVLHFDAVHMVTGDPELYTRSLFEERDRMNDFSPGTLFGMLDLLESAALYQTDAEYSRLNVHFQKLMELVLSRYTLPKTEQSPDVRVQSTIQYVDEHYAQDISVQKLARLANLRPAQFTALFRQITGRKPLEYLNHVRIEQAKEWLSLSDEPLRDIAGRVGFRDEYYFSRRFRQHTGLAPRQYDRSLQRHTLVQDWAGHEVIIPGHPERILYYGDSAGDLLALGLPVLDGKAYDVLPSIDLEWTVQKQPDLILLDSTNEQLYQRLSRIAPTLIYNSHASLEERIRKVGSWFGMELDAETWIGSYHRRTEEMWSSIKPWIQLGETASVLVHHRGARLFVMGNIGLAPFLYHPQGFTPVSKVQEALAAGRAYKEISTESISQYAGDHIFVMLPESDAARAATEKLFESDEWKELPAVKKGKVYTLDEQVWNMGDALSYSRLQSQFPELLKRTDPSSIIVN